MNDSNKLAAVVAYLLPVFGWLYIFIFRRQDKLAIFHTKQAIGLVLALIIAPLLWLLFGWLISFIPYVGFILAVTAFTLVIAFYLALAVAWLIGMVYAAQGKMKPASMIGRWVEYLPLISTGRTHPRVKELPPSSVVNPPAKISSVSGNVGEQPND